MIFVFSGYTDGMKLYRAITTVTCSPITTTPNIRCTFKNRCNQEASAMMDICVIKGMIMLHYAALEECPPQRQHSALCLLGVGAI